MTIRTSAPAPGTPTWLDFMCHDIDRTAGFFRDLLGWTLTPGGEEFGGYTVAASGGHDVTGFAPALAAGTPDVQTVYLATDDIAATVARARALGATVMHMGGQDIMPVADHGSMAVITDPSGATVGLWQAEQMVGCQVVDEPGAPCWFEVLTRDPDAAQAFYSGLFGITFAASDEGSLDYREARIGERTVFGLMAMPAEVPADVPAYWIGYYQVPDLDAAEARVGELGGSIVVPPQDIPAGRWLKARTPDGAVFALFAAK